MAATLENTSTSSIFEEASSFYAWTLTLADKRTKGWLLVDSPVPTIILTSLYLLTVWLGPKIMSSRKPFKLKWILVLYNVTMSAVNLHISYELYVTSSRLNYSYRCQPCKEVYNDDEFRVTKAIWWFYFSKLLEFADSFFFVLRKKDRQLTFLHVYHHSTMFPLWWIGVKFVPSGSSFLPAMINSFVHVLMYSYYALAAFGPAVTKFLWWKKYLTIIQLLQFAVALVMGLAALVQGCDFPMWMHYVMIFYMCSFLVLFGQFYIQSYRRGAASKLAKEAATRKAAAAAIANNNNDEKMISAHLVERAVKKSI